MTENGPVDTSILMDRITIESWSRADGEEYLTVTMNESDEARRPALTTALGLLRWAEDSLLRECAP